MRGEQQRGRRVRQTSSLPCVPSTLPVLGQSIHFSSCESPRPSAGAVPSAGSGEGYIRCVAGT